MKLNSIIVAAAMCVLGACAPKVETQPVTAELAPMELRMPVVGDTLLWDRGGKEVSRTVASISNGIQTVEGSDGCTFSHAVGFAPSQKWSNCEPFTDGTQIIKTDGQIYPLKIGNSMSFKASGESVNGGTWDATRVCKVEGTAKVTVPAGTFDTYHVTCNDEFSDRDFYMSPEVGTEVLFRRYRKRQGETLIQKLISFTPGTGAV